jgi:L-asparagine transporter-like permease
VPSSSPPSYLCVQHLLAVQIFLLVPYSRDPTPLTSTYVLISHLPFLGDFTFNRSQPISYTGSFNVYATRFFSPGYGFALSWNYWFNDAISVASDLTAAQLVLEFWSVPNPWIFSLTLWVFIVSVNAVHVKAYGELGGSCSYRISTVFLTGVE